MHPILLRGYDKNSFSANLLANAMAARSRPS